jgi:diguanylate cyclase (GGDEF)-like protein/PAS domain S-box-containing protein
LAADRLPAAVLKYASGTGVIAANEEWVRLSGLRPSQSFGDGWLEALEPEQRSAARRDLDRAARGDAVATEWRLAGTGSPRWLAVRVSADQDRDAGDAVCLAVLIDVTAQKIRERELLHRAAHDSLTGLLTKAMFVAEVERALARRERRPAGLAVLFVDLDRFKPINDHYGHALGDAVLVEAARRLAGCVRPSDAVARVGGDEFAVLCEDLSEPEDALRVTRRILDAASVPLRAGSLAAMAGVSIGVAFAGAGDDTAELLLGRSDQAMYRAKQLGRGRYAVFGSSAGAEPSTAGAGGGSQPGGDAGQSDPWRQRRDWIMGHICNAVLLLLDGRHGPDAIPTAGWLDPTMVELDAALAGLRTVDRVAERPDLGEGPSI